MSRVKSADPFGSRTDIGCVREQNEDSLLVAPPLFVVCDGMGGHAAGEVASEIAVNVVGARAPQNADAHALGRAVEEANLAIIKAAQEGRGGSGMGTTCTAAILENERLVIAQVGDSRAYLLHDGMLQQITRDHSLVADLVEAGKITSEEARYHPQRSMITRALGSDPHMQPDLYEINVESGDRLLLCSDGLTGMVSNDEIRSILSKHWDAQRCATQLVNAAIGAGGLDNITAVVADVTGFAAVKQARSNRRTRVTAGIIIGMLIAIIGGAAWLYNSITSSAAYLAETGGKVAIYSGLKGDFLGLSASKLIRVTDIDVDDLQPGLANRLRTDGVPTASVSEAEDLVADYEEELDAQKAEDLAKNQKVADSASSSTTSGTFRESSSSHQDASADQNAQTSDSGDRSNS